MFNKKTPKKNHGSVSFALLGVLIIFLSILAVAYISRVSFLGYRRKLRQEEVSSLEETGENIMDDIEYQIKAVAVDTAFELEGEKVNSTFKERVSDLLESPGYLNSLSKGGDKVIIEDYEVELYEDVASVDGIEPYIKTLRKGNLRMDSPGKTGETRTVFDYNLEGFFVLSIEDERAALEIEKKREIETNVHVPYPFLQKKMDIFESGVKSRDGHVSRLTRYILSTLAQYRAMLGHGMKAKEHLSNVTLGETRDMINLEDVELALNFALLSEIAHRFRAIDDESMDSIISNTGIQNATNLKDLLIKYSRSGLFDPADIISLYYGNGYDDGEVSKESSSELNLTSIVGQSMHTVSDEFILRYLDYLHISPIIGEVHGPFKSLDRFMGSDDHYIKQLVQSENASSDLTRSKILKNWVRNTFVASGLTNTWIMRNNFTYTPFPSYQGDEIEGYPRLSTEISEEFQYRLKLVGPEKRWYMYPCDHDSDEWMGRKGPCNEFIRVNGDLQVLCGMDEKLVGYQYKTIDYELSIDSGAPLCFHAEDILKGNKDLWMDFYYEFENRTDADVLGEYTLKAAVSDLIRDVTQRIYSEVINLDEKIHIDPEDQTSVFEGVQSKLETAFGKVTRFYRQNPDRVRNIIDDRLQIDGDRRVDDFKTWLKDNYDELIDKETALEETIRRTAIELTSPDSPYMELTQQSSSTNKGGINDECDQVTYEDVEPTRENLSFKIQNDEAMMDSIKDAISSSVENGFDLIKSREIEENDHSETSSEEDGAIIQALDYYQYEERVSLGTTSSDRMSKEPDNDISVDNNFRSTNSSGIEDRGRCRDEDVHKDQMSGKEPPEKSCRKEMKADFKPGSRGKIVNEKSRSEIYRGDSSFDIFSSSPKPDEDKPERKQKEPIDDIQPEPGFYITPSPSVPGNTITFIDESYDEDGEIIQWEWEFGDGTTSGEENTTHVYDKPGTYQVNLTVWDDDGYSEKATEELLIDNFPEIVDVSPPSNSSWETDQAVTFTFSEKVDGTTLEYGIYPSDVTYEVDSQNSDPLTGTEKLILTPKDYYQRCTDYSLTIEDIVDIDNGTHSHLQEPYTFGWKTKDYANVTAHHPTSSNYSIPIGRSIALEFSEPIQQDFNIEDMIYSTGSFNWHSPWVHSWYSADSRHIRFDHQRNYPHSEHITLIVKLSRLRSQEDGSKVTVNGAGDSTLYLSFYTRGKITYPEIRSSDPEPESTDFVPSHDIVIRFDRKMKPSTLQTRFEPNIGVDEFNWSSDNRTLRINHTGLQGSQRYKIFLWIEDLYGRPLNDSQNPFMFTTRDVDPPKVLSISHHDNLKRYLTDAPVSLIFSESIKAGSLDHGGTGSGWTPSWNMDRTRVHLKHDEFLKGSRCRFYLKNAKDDYGNPIPSWQRKDPYFRTSEKGDDIQATLPDRKLWSFLGGDIIRNSYRSRDWTFIGMLDSFGEETSSGIEDVIGQENLECRLPTELEEGSYRYSHRLDNALKRKGEDDNTKELSFSVDLEPDYIHLDDPSLVSKIEGKQLTNLHHLSDRALCQYWEVDLSDVSPSLCLTVKKEGPVTFSDGEPLHLALDSTFSVDHRFSIPVITGWRLQGFEYGTRGRTLMDVTSFLNDDWKELKNALFRLKDATQRIDELTKRARYDLQAYENKNIEALQFLARRYINGTPVKDLGQHDFSAFDRDMRISGSRLDIHISEGWENCSVPGGIGNHSRKVRVDIPKEGLCNSFSSTFTLLVMKNGTVAYGNEEENNREIGYIIKPSEGSGTSNISVPWLDCTTDLLSSDGHPLARPVSVEVPPVSYESPSELDDTLRCYSIALSDHINHPLNITTSDGDTRTIDLGFSFELCNRTDQLFYGSIQKAYRDSLRRIGITSDSTGLGTSVDFTQLLLRKLKDYSIIANCTDSVTFFIESNQGDIKLNYKLENTTSERLSRFLSKISTDIDKVTENMLYQRFSRISHYLLSTPIADTTLCTCLEDCNYVWERTFEKSIEFYIQEEDVAKLRLVYEAG